MKEREEKEKKERFKKSYSGKHYLTQWDSQRGGGEIYDPRYLWCFLSPLPNVGIAESPESQRTQTQSEANCEAGRVTHLLAFVAPL